MMTVVWIILAVLTGGILGWAFLPPGLTWLGDVVFGAICFLVFFAGMDVGQNWNVMKGLMKKGHQIIFVPVMIIVGSLIGAICASFFLPMNTWDVMAIAGALGWYSLAGPVISDITHQVDLGTVGFVANLMREILAFATIPLVARYIGFLPAVGPGAATTMDTTLPIISRFTNTETAMIAFFNGVILTMVPPILIPFCLKMAGW